MGKSAGGTRGGGGGARSGGAGARSGGRARGGAAAHGGGVSKAGGGCSNGGGGSRSCFPRGAAAAAAAGAQVVYHGTSKTSANAIMRGGFKASEKGMLGPGVYVTTDKGKAADFARRHGSDGRVLKAYAYLGKTTTVDASAAREGGFSESSWQRGFDSAFTPRGEGVNRPEHCVKDPSRVVPVYPMGVSKLD